MSEIIEQDALKARAEKAEAGEAAALELISASAHTLWKLPPADRTLATDAVWSGLVHFKPSNAGRDLLARMHAAEARVAELEAERDAAVSARIDGARAYVVTRWDEPSRLMLESEIPADLSGWQVLGRVMGPEMDVRMYHSAYVGHLRGCSKEYVAQQFPGVRVEWFHRARFNTVRNWCWLKEAAKKFPLTGWEAV